MLSTLGPEDLNSIQSLTDRFSENRSDSFQFPLCTRCFSHFCIPFPETTTVYYREPEKGANQADLPPLRLPYYHYRLHRACQASLP